MLTALRQRTAERDDDEGFTLIELMVVVLIIGILLAIAIPTFLGARNRANDRSTQSNLRNALTAEKTVFTDTQAYSSDISATGVLKGVEANLTWLATGPTAADATNSVGVISATSSLLVINGLSKSGKCYWIQDIPTGGTAGTSYGSSGGCATAPTSYGPRW